MVSGNYCPQYLPYTYTYGNYDIVTRTICIFFPIMAYSLFLTKERNVADDDGHYLKKVIEKQ